jgi:phospholipid/cholesterol/gamma-HCH transport system substrate-binding protein
MADFSKNILIGLFVLSAIAIASWSILFLNPSAGDGGQIVRVLFTNVDKVSVGTRVSFAGKPVGEVLEIRMVPKARLEAKEKSSPVYIYELTLTVDSSIPIFKTDEFSIVTSGLLGEKSVAITPMRHFAGTVPELINPDDLIYSMDTAGSVESAIARLDTLSEKVESTLDVVYNVFEENRQSISSSLGTLDMVLGQVKDKELVGNLSDASNSISQLASNLNKQLEDLDKEGFWKNTADVVANLKDITNAADKPEKIASIIDNFSDFASSLQQLNESILSIGGLMDKIAKGEGSLGKFVVDDSIYLQTSSIMSKAETLMNDVNHYGVLFHLDRKWQKQRTRRLNQFYEISNAQKFRTYFDEEMDQITTSLSRVSMLMDDAETNEDLMTSKQFQGSFSDLMRRFNSIQETLNNYNSQMNVPVSDNTNCKMSYQIAQ